VISAVVLSARGLGSAHCDVGLRGEERRRMPPEATTGPSLAGRRLRTPRAAAVAGIIFSVLMMAALVLLRLSVPDNPLERGAWLGTDANRVAIALNLVPFAGIAFLWFIGVLRARLGEREDRFFATVFLGSGLLFLAMLFVAAATAGSVIMAYGADPETMTQSATFTLARTLSYGIMNVYAVKVAGVFMITTSTITIYTGIAARWIAWLGYALALLLIFGGAVTDWTFIVFPLWILLLSGDILADDLGRARTRNASEQA
jgi:hypothetical protein